MTNETGHSKARKEEAVSDTRDAQAVAKFYTEKFQRLDVESARLTNLENEDFEFQLKTCRVKKNKIQHVLERLD